MSEQNVLRTVRVFRNSREQEDETRAYWLDKTVAEKMAHTADLVRNAYRLQGIDVDAQGSKRSVVVLQRARG